MAWIERTDKRGLTHKTWVDDTSPLKHRREEVLKTVLHYPSVVDGDLDTEVDFTPVRVDVPSFDGWRVTQNGWHYALGKDPANHGDEDGWVGFGGRSGQHWFKFRLLKVGYLHWPTRAWEDIGGAPTYNRSDLDHTVDDLTIGPDAQSEISIPVGNLSEWHNVWNTPAGGEASIRWHVDGRQLKEEVVLNEAARNWIAANRPPSTPPAETYFGFVYDLDVSDIPRWVKQGVLQNIDGDFDDTEGGIELQDAQGRLLDFMPISYAFSELYVAEPGGPEVKDAVRLRKRFWNDAGNHYLLVGALVPELNAMQAGDIVFDPTNVYQPADGKDNQLYKGSQGNDNNGASAEFTISANNAYTSYMMFEFDISDIGSDDTCDVATLSLYTNNGYTAHTITIYSVHVDNEAWPEGDKEFTTGVAGDSCWDYLDQDPVGETAWAGGGGCDTSGTDYEASALGTMVIPSEAPQMYDASLTTTRVEGWFDSPNTNYGMICQTNVTVYPKFAACEDSTASRRPKLTIEYTEAGVGDLSVEPTDEAVTVGDTATITPLVLGGVSEQDDITVVDTPTLRLDLDLPSQQDDITVGDTATVDPILLGDVSELDAVTVGDTPTLDPLIIGDVSETEDVTVGDTATVDALLLEVSESDAITTGETVTVDPVAPTEISELDAVTVGDTPTVVRPSIDVYNVSEQDDITVVDTPAVSLLDAETLSVSEQDDVTVGDTPTVSVPEATALDVSETDPITIGDTATLSPVYPLDIDVSDGITVTDTPTVQVPVEGVRYVSESENITVGDTATLSPVSPTDVSELDAVTVGDTPTVVRVVEGTYYISESDGVTVSDTPTLGPVTPTDISETDAVTVVDTPTVAFFQPILSLSVGDAVSITDLSTVEFPSDMLGLDKPDKKPHKYLKDILDMEPIVRPVSPTFALRQEQKSVMEANRVADQLARQNEQAAADRVSAMLAREKVDKDKADRRRASSLHNLAKAQLAKEAKAAKQAEINKVRKKNLQKARRKLKRQRKKKK